MKNSIYFNWANNLKLQSKIKAMRYGLLFLMILFATSCTGQQRVQSGAYDLMLKAMLSHSVDEISVDSLQKVQSHVLLLDARSMEEYEVSHIQDATFVGYDNFDSTAVDSIDRDQPTVVYCAVGYRSEKITEKLQKINFTNIANLYGGIFEWKNQGNQVVNAGGPTEKVHAYNKTWGVWLNEGTKVYK
jgi:rhodanese-related sulfurtransferase